MSKMSSFVTEVQEVVCENFNEPLDFVIEEVRQRFASEPDWKVGYAVETAESQYKQIREDLNWYGTLC